jgi:putative hydrolase of the HAD superfamily
MSRGGAARRSRAVVFDLFGTLIALEPNRLPSIRVEGTAVPSTLPHLAPRLRRYLPDVELDAFGRALRAASEDLRAEHATTLVEAPSRERFRRALVRAGCSEERLGEAAVVLSRAHHEAIGAATVFPAGHRAVLEAAARRGPVAVVSNFDDTASAMAILARHGILDALATVVVSEALGLRKPHPALLATVLDTLALEPADVVFVGDSFSADVGVAHALGADAAWIDAEGRGVPEGARPPRWVLRRLEELPALLAASDAAG